MENEELSEIIIHFSDKYENFCGNKIEFMKFLWKMWEKLELWAEFI